VLDLHPAAEIVDAQSRQRAGVALDVGVIEADQAQRVAAPAEVETAGPGTPPAGAHEMAEIDVQDAAGDLHSTLLEPVRGAGVVAARNQAVVLEGHSVTAAADAERHREDARIGIERVAAHACAVVEDIGRVLHLHQQRQVADAVTVEIARLAVLEPPAGGDKALAVGSGGGERWVGYGRELAVLHGRCGRQEQRGGERQISHRLGSIALCNTRRTEI
jgi:hypothetical protein